MLSHNDKEFQDFKMMFIQEHSDEVDFDYDLFLKYVQVQQSIRIADSLEKINKSLSHIENAIKNKK